MTADTILEKTKRVVRSANTTGQMKSAIAYLELARVKAFEISYYPQSEWATVMRINTMFSFLKGVLVGKLLEKGIYDI